MNTLRIIIPFPSLFRKKKKEEKEGETDIIKRPTEMSA